MRKLNNLGYTKMELMIIVVLLGIVAFITINKTSYAFAIDSSSSVTEIENLIELQAEDYAMDNLNLFNESKTAFITVNDLIEKNYLIGNSDGLITDPSDSKKNYNDAKIKLEYKEDEKKD